MDRNMINMLAVDIRDDLRTMSNRAVDSGMAPNDPEVMAVMKAYHALAAHFGYPTDLS